MFRVEVCAEHKIELTQRCISNATTVVIVSSPFSRVTRQAANVAHELLGIVRTELIDLLVGA
jgi:hypothetical protein